MSHIRLRTTPGLEDTDSKRSDSPMADAGLSHQLPGSIFLSAHLPWLAAGVLLLTTALGTYRSFSLFASDNPDSPIHQLTRVPVSSLVSPHMVRPGGSTNALPYFAKKTNFFNQTFVKLGWAWTSLAIWAHIIPYASHHTREHPARAEDERRQSERTHVPRTVGLHLAASVLWVFLTQWFFGSSLIERLLIISGARCVPSVNQPSHPESKMDGSSLLANAYCQRQWGQRLPGLDAFTVSTHRPYWDGGVDISGHTFLLTFSILLILSTLRPSLAYLVRPQPLSTTYRASIYANLALVALWWWMLLMTSLYFHGPVEKASGLLVGTGAWWIAEWAAAKLVS